MSQILSKSPINELSGREGGRKQVPWGKVLAHNEWYIDKVFLLKGKTLFNPNQISEATIKAYWDHWYQLAQKGQEFSFKTVEDYKGEKPTDGDSDNGEPMEVDKPSGAGGSSGDEQQAGEDTTPKHCKSEGEKIAFLHALHPQSENMYHSVITAVASMKVGICLMIDYHLLISYCVF